VTYFNTNQLVNVSQGGMYRHPLELPIMPGKALPEKELEKNVQVKLSSPESKPVRSVPVACVHRVRGTTSSRR
jgi:hypothetical protein